MTRTADIREAENRGLEKAAAYLEKKGHRVCQLHIKRGNPVGAVLVSTQYDLEAAKIRAMKEET